MAKKPSAKPADVHRQFSEALDALVETVKRDRSVLATILCGSLSHDTVWAKSDIDLVLITIDDRKLDKNAISLWADGINVHALLLPRAEFRKIAEGSIRSSFFHSFLAKGKLLYTHDESIAEICNRLHALGERDVQIRLLGAAAGALSSVYKAHKWLLTRRDLEYTAVWILHAASSLADIEVLEARQLVDRETLPRALKLNPQFFTTIYTGMLNTKKTAANVQAALDAVDDYLAQRATRIFGPVLEHLREVGEARSATEIDDHFKRNYGIEGVAGVCEYLADQGLITKVPLAARLTKRSNVDVQELGYFCATRAADAW